MTGLVISDVIFKRIIGYALLNQLDIYALANDAVDEFLDANAFEEQPHRGTHLVSMSSDRIEAGKKYAKIAGISFSRVVEKALDRYLIEHVDKVALGSAPTPDIGKPRVNSALTDSDGRHTCLHCSHSWKSRSGSPPYCPRCKRQDWNVSPPPVEVCEECGRPGDSPVCTPCVERINRGDAED